MSEPFNINQVSNLFHKIIQKEQINTQKELKKRY